MSNLRMNNTDLSGIARTNERWAKQLRINNKNFQFWGELSRMTDLQDKLRIVLNDPFLDITTLEFKITDVITGTSLKLPTSPSGNQILTTLGGEVDLIWKFKKFTNTDEIGVIAQNSVIPANRLFARQNDAVLAVIADALAVEVNTTAMFFKMFANGMFWLSESKRVNQLQRNNGTTIQAFEVLNFAETTIWQLEIQ